jgi:hypothetical protein
LHCGIFITKIKFICLKTGQYYFVEYQKQLEAYSNLELIDRFNEEVNNGGSGSARYSFLAALHFEFIRRGFDYSEFGDSDSLSFKQKVTLKNNAIKSINKP